MGNTCCARPCFGNAGTEINLRADPNAEALNKVLIILYLFFFTLSFPCDLFYFPILMLIIKMLNLII